MRTLAAAVVLSLAATLTAAVPTAADRVPRGDPDRATGQQARAPMPRLRVRRQVGGLRIPWDVQQLGRGALLITERSTRRLILWKHGRKHRVRYPRRSVWARSETGLMSIAVAPRFRRTRTFYTCHGRRKRPGHDIVVFAWRLNRAGTRARLKRRLLTGIQATTGRHGGCRLLLAPSGALLVGTGDAAVGRNPQDRTSLNGKVLRLDPATGAPWPTNPWANAPNRNRRYVLTYGHRNVQGLARRPGGGVWSVEHGSWRDDEVNRLGGGRNYGWNPVPGYDESVPMTDHSLPGRQYGARWRSGRPTIATSGAAWVRGRRWGRLNGTLAVATLKGSRLVFLKFDARGRFRWARSPRAVRGFGRLRSVTRTRGGDLLVTTSNGRGDAVLRVSPRARR